MMKANCGYCGKEITPTPRQVGQIKRNRKIYCGNKDCSKKAQRKRMRDRYRAESESLKEIECGYRKCNNKFMQTRSDQLYCPGTNHYYLESLLRNHVYYKSYKKPYYARTTEKKSGRKCKICGDDTGVNYFFCNYCHGRVGDNDVSEEHNCRTL